MDKVWKCRCGKEKPPTESGLYSLWGHIAPCHDKEKHKSMGLIDKDTGDLLAVDIAEARAKGLLEDVTEEVEEEETAGVVLRDGMLQITPEGLIRCTVTFPPEAFTYYNLAMAWHLEGDESEKMNFDQWLFKCITIMYEKSYGMRLVLAPIGPEEKVLVGGG